MIGDEALVAELAATDVRLAEAVARRVELMLALRRGPGATAPVPARPLSDQGLRELHRFVLDLTRREAARAENRRRAGSVEAARVARRPSAIAQGPPAGDASPHVERGLASSA